ncbi:MAG: hypothetical protein V1770_05425 [bacterium]
MTNSLKHYCLSPFNNFISASPDFNVMALNDKDDRKNLKFHLESNEYFGILAAILDLAGQIAEQKIRELEKINQAQSKLLKGLKEDLMYLQENYKIVKKKNG